MSINIVRFLRAGRVGWGVARAGSVTPLDHRAETLRDFIIDGGIEEARSAAASREAFPLRELEILSPATDPCTIVCQGKNYAAHLRETGGAPSDQPFNLLFGKASSSLTAPHGSIERPPGVELLDYELELGLIIARTIDRGLKIGAGDLGRHLAGVIMANDVSARDVQIPEGQWYRGKSFRTFCPAGPFFTILSGEELERLPELVLRLSVNGAERQKASVGEMLFSPAQTLELISSFMDLRAGDLVLTGTPSGVALRIKVGLKTKLAQALLSPARLKSAFIGSQRANGRYLEDGDVIESSVRTEDGSIDLGCQRLNVRSASMNATEHFVH